MAGIQVGGIVSGLDTNSIVDKLMEQAKVPLDRLNGQYEYKKLEDTVYSDFNDKLKNIASDLLNLRLESTFKTKKTTSTNESVVTATSTTGAAIGNHSIQVTQLARNSQASSSYTRYALSQAGANITKVTGLAPDYLDAVHTVTVAQEGSDYVATTETKVNNVGLMTKSKGSTLDGVTNGAVGLDAEGLLQSDLTGDFTVSYTDANGNAQTLTVNGTFANSAQDITVAAQNLENKLNAGLNDAMGTSAVQYVSMRAEYNSGTWNMAMYETTVDDHNISVGGTDAATLRDEFGFSENYTPTTSTTTTMYKYHVGTSLTDLESKALSAASGVVAGASFTMINPLSEGTFVIAQDASLKVSSDTYSYYTSAAASSGSGLDVNADGLDAAGFAESVSASTNGYFTINDVKISIDDYTKLSVNDLLGVINSSGAGVTASYDSSADKFTIRSNTVGATSISLGGYGDTSDMLSIMKLDYNSSPTLVTGSTAGNIDAASGLTNSGLTTYPYSGTFTINGVSIYVDATTESLNDVITKVNKSGAGVTMTYDSISDKVILKSNSIDPIEVGASGDTSNLLEALNLTDDTTVTNTIGTTGQRAILSVDGTTYVRESNSVSDIINGVTLSLNGTSSSYASINIAVDTDKAVSMFAKFVGHYNEVMEALNVPEKSDTEDNYTTYLSDTKKATMSDSDITDYQAYYKLYNTYDIIRRSSELRSLKTSMRSLFFAERPGMTGSVNDMSDIGIKVAGAGDLDTENYGYLVELTTDYDTIKEKLTENTDFMNQITNNPDDVFKFFANSSDDESATGWARYYNSMLVDRYTGTDGMIGNKLGLTGTIQTDLNSLEDRITTQQDRIEQQLERYWSQFTAMEQAISDAQSQATSFTQASGSGG